MAEESVPVWPRPYFKAGSQPIKIFFVCFGRAPLADVELSRSRFGLPSPELLAELDAREVSRDSAREWFENWWGGAFGVYARQDLQQQLGELTCSDVCLTLALEVPDRGDLAPLQTLWGVARWLCERGASVVLDVHAFRFRTRAEVEALTLTGSDVERDVKIVFETGATQGDLHLLHTRGMCKFARPELLCFIEPDDVAAAGRIVNQVARTLLEGAQPQQIRLKVAEGVEVVAGGSPDQALVDSLGLEAAVLLTRKTGEPLAGIRQQAPAA